MSNKLVVEGFMVKTPTKNLPRYKGEITLGKQKMGYCLEFLGDVGFMNQQYSQKFDDSSSLEVYSDVPKRVEYFLKSREGLGGEALRLEEISDNFEFVFERPLDDGFLGGVRLGNGLLGIDEDKKIYHLPEKRLGNNIIKNKIGIEFAFEMPNFPEVAEFLARVRKD